MAGITEYIEQLLDKQDLSFERAESLLDTIFEGEVAEAQVAAFLTAMRAKGVAAGEVAGLAKSLRAHAVQVKVDVETVDTCGTGGAKVKTFNVSTASALVTAGAGAYVAKHGNRGITSKCGSADVLAELGVNIEADADTITRCIEQAHIGFMFAPMFHPAMKYVQPVRKALGFRTVFNILGPLANPAAAQGQVLGVADETLMSLVAEALNLLGVKRAMIVHSDGLDEVSTMGPTKTLEIRDGKLVEGKIEASDYGIATADIGSLTGGDAQTNAKIVTDIISGKEDGPRKDIVVLNAATAIVVAGLADDIAAGIEAASASIADGKANQCLEKLVEVSNS